MARRKKRSPIGIAERVLERPARPAIYHYTQTFDVRGGSARIGLIARVRLEEFDRGRILPHERTFPAAKEDRLRLLTALRINMSSIFGLYSAAHPELDSIAREGCRAEPLIDLVDDLGIGNELRAIEAPDEIAIVQRALEASADADRRRAPSLRNRAELSARAAATRTPRRAQSRTTT